MRRPTHVSTFSGGGFSCLGYRMAGFPTLWANDSHKPTWETFRANHPEAILDTRSITDVSGADILKATGLDVGELDVFEGSPPCTPFSGLDPKARRKWGVRRSHAGANDVKVEELAFECSRLIGELMPRVFALENVPRWADGECAAYFYETRRRARAHGYRVEALVLNACDFGVPQDRRRLIMIGVRDDLGIAPPFPRPCAARLGVRDVLPGALHVQGYEFWKPTLTPASLPMPTVAKSPRPFVIHFENGETRPPTIDELRLLCGVPMDYVLLGSKAQQHARLGNSVPPPLAFAIASAIREALEAKGLITGPVNAGAAA